MWVKQLWRHFSLLWLMGRGNDRSQQLLWNLIVFSLVTGVSLLTLRFDIKVICGIPKKIKVIWPLLFYSLQIGWRYRCWLSPKWKAFKMMTGKRTGWYICEREDDITIHFKEINAYMMNWMELVEDRDHWTSLDNAELNFRVS